MPSRLIRRLIPAASALALLAATAPAAHAVPLLGIGASAGAYGGFLTGGPGGFMYELDANAQALGFDVAGTYMGAGSNTWAEAGLRSELSFLPMLSVKPMLGYQTQTFYRNSFDHGPVFRIDAAFSPILSPIWVEAMAGASYPLGLGQPMLQYLAGGYFAFLPVASVGVRYRGFQGLQATSNSFGALEVGLRVNI